jgi:hypothetical protein
MTPRIFHTDKPTRHSGRVLPMNKTDAEFWRLRRERKEQEKRA